MVVQLTVVLMCQGRGADKSSYRPQRDESQWWNRRDALVRCVTAFLFGPTPHELDSRELILLHDEDMATMHLSYDGDGDKASPTSFIPTEQNILSIFKAAAKALQKQPRNVSSGDGVLVRQQGMSCRIRPASLPSDNLTMIGRNGQSSSSMSMASKRDVLQTLQSQCTIDFLRQHHLNCSADVCLKKTNKEKLLHIWKQWLQHHQPQSTSDNDSSKPSEVKKENAKSRVLESIFWDILQGRPQQSSSSSSRCKRVAAILHESCESELPCFGLSPANRKFTVGNDGEETLQVFLFLGAVRDMHGWEEEALQRAWSRCCGANKQTTVPTPLVPLLLRIRLGPVPEFTSKILTVLAFHHATGMLEMGLRRMMEATAATKNSRKAKNMDGYEESRELKHSSKRRRLEESSTSHEKHHHTSTASSLNMSKVDNPWLHVICFLPISLDQFSTALEDRNRVLWCLVRVTVCTLWRSRVASSSTSGTSTEPSNSSTTEALLERNVLNNTLTVVFSASSDKDSKSESPLVLTVRAEEFVSSLAQQHQAAPTEHQLLQIWKQRLEQALNDQHNAKQKDDGRGKTLPSTWAPQLISSLQRSSSSTIMSTHTSQSDPPIMALAVGDPPHAKGSGRRYPTSLSDRFYASLPVFPSKQQQPKNPSPSLKHLMVLLPISQSDMIPTPTSSSSSSSRHINDLIRACHLQHIAVDHDSVISTVTSTACQDYEAATVTLLQHLAYQQRLVSNS